jgi:hypothetical protein
VLGDLFEERVEARPAEHANVGAGVGTGVVQADFAALDFELPDFLSPVFFSVDFAGAAFDSDEDDEDDVESLDESLDDAAAGSFFSAGLVDPDRLSVL